MNILSASSKLLFAVLIFMSFLGKGQCLVSVDAYGVTTNTAPGIKIHLAIRTNFTIGDAVIGFRTDSCKHYASEYPKFKLDSVFIKAGYTAYVSSYNCSGEVGFGTIQLVRGNDSIIAGQHLFGILYFPIVTGSTSDLYGFNIVHNMSSFTPYSGVCGSISKGGTGFFNEPLPGPTRVFTINPLKFTTNFTVYNLYLNSTVIVRDFSGTIMYQVSNITNSTQVVQTSTWRAGYYYLFILDEEGNETKFMVQRK